MSESEKPSQDSVPIEAKSPSASQAVNQEAASVEEQNQSQPDFIDWSQEVKRLEQELAQAQARTAEFHDAYLRSKAEHENIRRRSQEDVAKAHKYSVESMAESLVPVMDSLEAALKIENASLENYRSGVELTLKQLTAAFEKSKIIAISPEGERFDPNKHQAISMVPVSEGMQANHVVSVLQKGFVISDRILRPALVVVAQG